MFYTYILHSKKDGKLYTGYTPDLKNRIKSHEKGFVLATKNINYGIFPNSQLSPNCYRILMHDGFYKHYGLKHQSGLFHYMEDLLGEVKRIDSNPIIVPRSSEKQVQVCCRDYAVLLTSFLREKQIPARARCGFAHFDEKDKNWYDHWFCEYWSDKDNTWKKVDAQLNPHVRQVWNIKFDPYDAPKKLYKFSGELWIAWRENLVDASRFIIDNLNGSWLIRANLLRDFASLNKIEIEPHMMRINLGLNWNSWRLLSAKDSDLSKKDWELLDKIALLTVDADKNLLEIHGLFKDNIDLQPPKDLYQIQKESWTYTGIYLE